MVEQRLTHLNTKTPNVPVNIFATVPSAEKQCYCALRVDYGINTRIITPFTANGGTVTADESRVVMQTGTDPNGRAGFYTNKRLRYLNSFGGQVDFTSVFDSEPQADSHQIIGLGDDQDGFFVGYNGLDFGVMRRRDGVDFWTYEDEFNGDGALRALWDKSLGNIYRIDFQWLGYGFIVFFVEDPKALRRQQFTPYALIHAIEYPNTSELTHTLNPTTPIYAEVKNFGNTTNVTLRTPSASASLQGGPVQPHPLDLYNSADNLASFSDTNNNHLLSVRNNSTINSINNRVPMELVRVSFSRGSTGTNAVRFRLYRNGTTAGVRAYTNVDAVNSPASTSTTTTTVTSVSPEQAYILNQNEGVATIDFSPGEFVLQPNEWVTIASQSDSGQATTVGVTLTWREQF